MMLMKQINLINFGDVTGQSDQVKTDLPETAAHATVTIDSLFLRYGIAIRERELEAGLAPPAKDAQVRRPKLSPRS